MNGPWCKTVFENDRQWFVSGNHKGSLDDDWFTNVLAPNKPVEKDMEEYYIQQEANMGGEYFRIIGKRKDDETTYFGSSKEHNWYFDKPFAEWKAGDTVKNMKTQKEYIVYERCEKYKKALILK